MKLPDIAFKASSLLSLIGVLALATCTGCASMNEGEQARSLLDRVEFDEDEYGTFELEGNIDLNPIPLFSTNVHIKLEKTKDKPAQVQE